MKHQYSEILEKPRVMSVDEAATGHTCTRPPMRLKISPAPSRCLMGHPALDAGSSRVATTFSGLGGSGWRICAVLVRHDMGAGGGSGRIQFHRRNCPRSSGWRVPTYSALLVAVHAAGSLHLPDLCLFPIPARAANTTRPITKRGPLIVYSLCPLGLAPSRCLICHPALDAGSSRAVARFSGLGGFGCRICAVLVRHDIGG